MSTTQDTHVIRAGETSHGAFELDLTPQRAGWEFSSLRVLRLEPGAPLDIPGSAAEFLVLPLSGGCRVEVGATTYDIEGRDSVFTDITDSLYVPRDTDIRLVPTSPTTARIALPGARATRDLPVRYCPRGEVLTAVRGAGDCSRQVNNYSMGNAVETSHLLACEVLTPGGNWSSYPPHKHDEDTAEERQLEEVYYYEVRAGADAHPGFALQRIYPSPGHDIDVCTEVRSGDVVVMPFGYHGPTVAAPGYDLYYLNVMAGPAEDAVWMTTFDPAHAWIRDTWGDEVVDPRLPMTPMN